MGYMRVSTVDQNLDLQRDALKRAHVDEIYKEHASGKSLERPELANVLRALRSGDTLVVWRFDRMGRSLVNLVQIWMTCKSAASGWKASRRKSIPAAPAAGCSSSSSS